MTTDRRVMPKELVKRAEQVAQRAAANAKLEAQEHIELIRRRGSAIAESFFDIGVSLQKLNQPRFIEALGFKTFAEVLEAELKMSRTQAYRLMQVVEQIPRQEAVQLGPARSYAVLELAKATPELDSVATLLRDGVTLPGRAAPVDVRALTVREIQRAAQVERRSHLRKRHRATDAELDAAEKLATRIERALAKVGVPAVEVQAVRKRKGSDGERIFLRLTLPGAAGSRFLQTIRAK